MIHVAGPTDLFWTVSAGMGFTVLAVVIILLNLLLKSARALDTRVDHVWSAAVGVFVHTLTAAPQLKVAERYAHSAAAQSPAAQPAAPWSQTAVLPSPQSPRPPGRRQ
jgi:hypothetical protein